MKLTVRIDLHDPEGTGVTQGAIYSVTVPGTADNEDDVDDAISAIEQVMDFQKAVKRLAQKIVESAESDAPVDYAGTAGKPVLTDPPQPGGPVFMGNRELGSGGPDVR